ncbi:MFS transporter [Streptomyces sp. 71268]|uniref:MFS transporter n=1 Tax=Streptomyces sp. 71268 TaxID=3002640 RepID=UPI0023F8733C|nr:MFS transporter [Streptomyces sp. 71268]WEV28769.1 MFS transporter [Streptomyces sp. 71268]
MLSVLRRHRGYRRLFTAQVVALVGTGLATVALSLLAYDLAGSHAGSVLGTALAIKMVAYVGLAPLISALAHQLPPRPLLVGADLVRAAVALTLPFVDAVWQVYALIFVLQAASATFTPAFQSLIPQLLPAEDDYTRALSLSRLAYDLEILFSPLLAAALLSRITYDWLFLGTVAGFLGSAALVLSAALPGTTAAPAPSHADGAPGFAARVTRGTRIFLATPRLRALLALTLAIAAGGAMVMVNTIGYVRDHLGRGTSDVPVALGAYGAGSIAAALLFPALLRRASDHTLMLPAAFASAALLLTLAALTRAGAGAWQWPALLALWCAFGVTESVIMTPTGRLIRRSASAADLNATFTAQFSLAHGCWLLTYPVAGWLGSGAGLSVVALVLGAVALGAALAAWRLWPAPDTAYLPHVHTTLAHGHPHLADAQPAGGGWRHTHEFVIDDLHERWPLRPRHT